MISAIRGIVVDIDRDAVVLETSDGVGYAVIVSARDRQKLMDHKRECSGVRCVVYVRSVTRETGTTLYGFWRANDRAFFDIVCAADGCGPGTAMRALSAMEPAEFEAACARGDAKALAGIKGLGAKTIAKLIETVRR